MVTLRHAWAVRDTFAAHSVTQDEVQDQGFSGTEEPPSVEDPLEVGSYVKIEGIPTVEVKGIPSGTKKAKYNGEEGRVLMRPRDGDVLRHWTVRLASKGKDDVVFIREVFLSKVQDYDHIQRIWRSLVEKETRQRLLLGKKTTKKLVKQHGSSGDDQGYPVTSLPSSGTSSAGSSSSISSPSSEDDEQVMETTMLPWTRLKVTLMCNIIKAVTTDIPNMLTLAVGDTVELTHIDKDDWWLYGRKTGDNTKGVIPWDCVELQEDGGHTSKQGAKEKKQTRSSSSGSEDEEVPPPPPPQAVAPKPKAVMPPPPHASATPHGVQEAHIKTLARRRNNFVMMSKPEQFEFQAGDEVLIVSPGLHSESHKITQVDTDRLIFEKGLAADYSPGSTVKKAPKVAEKKKKKNMVMKPKEKWVPAWAKTTLKNPVFPGGVTLTVRSSDGFESGNTVLIFNSGDMRHGNMLIIKSVRTGEIVLEEPVTLPFFLFANVQKVVSTASLLETVSSAGSGRGATERTEVALDPRGHQVRSKVFRSKAQDQIDRS